MNDALMNASVRNQRAALGLSQADLAARVGVSRQAISAIEAGKQVPSTLLALHLARALNCRVEHLFRLTGGRVINARRPPGRPDTGRVVLGRVQDEWVAHPVDDLTHAADGLILEPDTEPESASVEVFDESLDIDTNVLVAGCAPLLGLHADRLGRRHRNARATWLHANSSKSLKLLELGLVHIAGVHLADSDHPDAHVQAARQAMPGQRSVLVNLAQWRQGLVVAPGNPLEIDIGSGLLRPELRLAVREHGAAAQRLLERILRRAAGGGSTPLAEPINGTKAANHDEVARLVQWGMVDAGVAIEAAALAAGLDFIPVSEERFDLIVPEALLDHGPVERFLCLIDQPSFRAEARALPGYDLSIAGHSATVDAA
ncbi:MAG: helix-turn-helix domain-containing protein [Longimicrobiales bacterium]|nr:helix-turn-helix domain-containing protein [Longimicrobiales bacterium]